MHACLHYLNIYPLRRPWAAPFGVGLTGARPFERLSTGVNYLRCMQARASYARRGTLVIRPCALEGLSRCAPGYQRRICLNKGDFSENCLTKVAF